MIITWWVYGLPVMSSIGWMSLYIYICLYISIQCVLLLLSITFINNDSVCIHLHKIRVAMLLQWGHQHQREACSVVALQPRRPLTRNVWAAWFRVPSLVLFWNGCLACSVHDYRHPTVSSPARSSRIRIFQEYSVQLTFREQWLDERLKFNDFGGRLKYLTLTESNRVWMPDLFFSNEKEGHFHNIIMPNVYIRIFPYGSVLYSIRYLMRRTRATKRISHNCARTENKPLCRSRPIQQ